MYPVRSVFEGRWRFPCASVLLVLYCHAYADGVANSGSDGHRPPVPARSDKSLHAYPGLAAPESAGAAGCAQSTACSANEEPQSAQSGYLLGIKKYFTNDRLFSRLGFFGYGARIDGTQQTAAAEASGQDGLAPGRMNGYMLNLNLQPTSQNAVDLRYGWGGFSYVARDNLLLGQGLMSRGVKYALYFDDCLRLEGLYGRSSGLDRFGFGLAQDNWSVALAGGAGTSLQVGYSIPLERSGAKSSECNAGRYPGRSLDAAADSPLRPAVQRRDGEDR